jgi:hypothetical protein
MKTLILESFERLKLNSQGQTERIYRVTKAKNTVQFHPGQELYSVTVAELCDNPSWDVTIVAPSARK